MGAAMLLLSIGFKANDRSELDHEQADVALAQARLAIEALPQARFDAINEEMGGEYTDLTQYRQLLLNDVTAIAAALADDRGDATFIAGGFGVVLLISGGLSWGNAPTELFESISRLRHAEVMPDARWPTEP